MTTSKKKSCVIGYPIKHSRSPQLHGFWLKQHNIDGDYTAHEVAPDKLGGFLNSIRDGSSIYSGGNATIPHKEELAKLADHCDPSAQILGAANTFWIENGKLHCSNTDAYGFLANLDQQAPQWDKADEKTAIVLGAGGAARAIVYGLITRHFSKIFIGNRTVERATNVATQLKQIAQDHKCELITSSIEQVKQQLPKCDLVVNTTSLGMENQLELDFPLTNLNPKALVTDIVYAPLETQLLANAKARGNKTVDGIGMLLHQAVPGFEKWFGVRPQVTAELRAHVLALK